MLPNPGITSAMRILTSPLLEFLLLISTLSSTASAGDIMKQNQVLKDGDQLASVGNTFMLGFFSPGSSKNRYLGIWYIFDHKTVVWVANREDPIPDLSGALYLTVDGNLILLYQTNKVLWSSGTSNTSNPVAQLLESGNFIVKDAASNVRDAVIWQSFDHPTDTLLPDMKLGLDLASGFNRHLTAWKSVSDPSPSDNFCIMEFNGSHETYIKSGQTKTYRLGIWNGLRFSGIPRMASYDMFRFNFVYRQDEIYYTFQAITKGIVSRLYIDSMGILRRVVWNKQTQTWNPFWEVPKEDCDSYAKCGPNGVCDNEAPEICQCYKGFEPKSRELWHLRDYRLGCLRKEKLVCGTGEGFVQVKGLKLPETVNSVSNLTMNFSQCESQCLKNCSCLTYAAANISGSESGCIMWFADLIDARHFAVDGQDLFLKVPASELDQPSGSNKRKSPPIIVTIVLLLLLLSGVLIWVKRIKKKITVNEATRLSYCGDTTKWKDDLPLFDFAAICTATNNFSTSSKIGEGGFGSVYKGVMEDGEEVAIKRLSKASGQGLDEFMNEVILIAKLQHRNLVRLLGCCIEGDERILLYEYMQNKSLDNFIFGRDTLLDWRKRVDIIFGIARGLLYLHQDSRLRIIHRDLKAANILLDGSMHPKISDFGTARIFGTDQTVENTRRVIGTYGYMAPEYAMDGIFSEKSDVFSFGVVLLEIISGKKNRALHRSDDDMNLLALAWRLWSDEKSLELLDETLTCSCPSSEVLRCIQVGLLCVQECAADRPTMSSVVFMLNSDSMPLPEPERPGFCQGRSTIIAKEVHSSSEPLSCKINEVTLTKIEAR